MQAGAGTFDPNDVVSMALSDFNTRVPGGSQPEDYNRLGLPPPPDAASPTPYCPSVPYSLGHTGQPHDLQWRHRAHIQHHIYLLLLVGI